MSWVGNILEVWTGKGYFTVELAKEGYKFVSIDLSGEEQEFARLNIKYFGFEKHVDFRIENAEYLSFGDSSFDTIFSINTIHHLANPVKVKIKGARVLDIQIAGITREVNNISIRNQVMKDTEASAEVFFDFIDYQDGALIKILTVGNKGEISLSGDIIGMPEGIKNVEEISRSKSAGTVSGWVLLSAIIAGLTLSAFIYYWVTGSWNFVWLILVPIGILILIIVAAVSIETWSWPSRRPSFPTSLDLPNWCRPFYFYPSILMREELLEMRLEEKTRKVEEESESKKGN